MRFMFHILSRSKLLNIDNNTLSGEDMSKKIEEEAEEVAKAISIYLKNKNFSNFKEIIKETYDVIQVAILILWRSNKIAKEEYKKPNLLKELNLEHKDKLITERLWEPVTGIEVVVKEWLYGKLRKNKSRTVII